MQSLRELRRLCLVGLPISVLWAGDGPSIRPAAPSHRGAATASIEGQVVVSRALTARRPRFRIYAEPGPGAVPPAPDSADVDERQNIIVYIEQAPVGATEPTKAATLRQHDERFLPHVLPVVRGTTVAFPNDDPLFHNVFSLSRAKSFDLGRYARGSARSVTFDRSGIVQVFCHIHSDMSAVALVLDNPYFAVPDAEGRYTIPHLPPGDYTVVAWHERIRPITHRLHLEPDQVAQLDFTIPLPPAEAAHSQ
jgi:plastocyanin